jgi:alkaline phosphatase D
MDGFRWDYPEIYGLEHIQAFGERGVRAKSLQPAFPSKTFPNHYTLATGLYPDHHGIVMNSFFDPVENRAYRISDRSAVMDGSFYQGEPIWVTAEKQGVRTASFYWVGSEAAIQGIQPAFWKEYDHHFPYGQRIDTVIHWFSLPQAKRPGLVMLYFDEPDGIGHKYGPEHPETGKTLLEMDSLFAVLLQKLAALPLHDSLNIILLSDHGMGSIAPERSIFLDSLLPAHWVLQAQGGNPVYNLQVAQGFIDSVMWVLGNTPNLKAWKKGEAPEHLHYRSHPRLLDVTVVADSAWSIYWGSKAYSSRGTHGFDPTHKDMHAIFMAAGPSFKEGYERGAFENVEIYGIVAYLLGIEAAKTDGKIEKVLDLFRD